jgi:hypothetical protein
MGKRNSFGFLEEQLRGCEALKSGASFFKVHGSDGRRHTTAEPRRTGIR